MGFVDDSARGVGLGAVDVGEDVAWAAFGDARCLGAGAAEVGQYLDGYGSRSRVL
jgi:hypothetical protein